MKVQKEAADMTNEKIENKKEAKQLTDEEIKTVAGGMKVAPDDQSSWWRSIVDFFFKKKS